jgi:hypothetical protein
LQGLLADLPPQAQALVEKLNRQLAKIQEQTEHEAARIRERAEAKVAEAERKAEDRRGALLQQATEQLEPLQKELFREGDLARALAVAVQIQALRGRAQNVLPDPGTLLGGAQVGKTYHFRVTGATEGPVWGTDVYTADSHLASAAVHAGAVAADEEAVVRVSVVDMSGMPARGSRRNGVPSMDWGPYPVGYRVARAEPRAEGRDAAPEES